MSENLRREIQLLLIEEHQEGLDLDKLQKITGISANHFRKVCNGITNLTELAARKLGPFFGMTEATA